MRPPHTKISIFHNEPPFHSCIYYSATGDEYQKFKLIISSSTSDLVTSRQTGICHTDLIKPFSQKASKVFATPLCSVIFPSTILSIFTPLISMVLLVGVIPKNSPL